MLQRTRRRVTGEDVFVGFVIASPAVVAALLVFMATVELGRVVNDPLFYGVYAVVFFAIFAPTAWSWYNRIDGQLLIQKGEWLLRGVVTIILASTVQQMVWQHTDLLDLFWRIVVNAVLLFIILASMFAIFPGGERGWLQTTRFAVLGWTVALILLGLTYVTAVLDVTWEVTWWQVLIRVILLLVMPVAFILATAFAVLSQPEEPGDLMYTHRRVAPRYT